MPKTNQGYLLIADITGYTRFLSESELEHAQDTLTALLEHLSQAAEQSISLDTHGHRRPREDLVLARSTLTMTTRGPSRCPRLRVHSI